MGLRGSEQWGVEPTEGIHDEYGQVEVQEGYWLGCDEGMSETSSNTINGRFTTGGSTGNIDGTSLGAVENPIDGLIEGATLGAIDGESLGAIDGESLGTGD